MHFVVCNISNMYMDASCDWFDGRTAAWQLLVDFRILCALSFPLLFIAASSLSLCAHNHFTYFFSFFTSSLSLSLNLFTMLKPMHLCYISHFLFCPRVRVRFCVRQQIQIQQNTNTISFLFCYLMRFSKQIRSNKENELKTLKNSICFMLNIKYLYTCEGDTILSEMF